MGTEEAISYSDSAVTISSAIPAFAKKGDLTVVDQVLLSLSCLFYSVQVYMTRAALNSWKARAPLLVVVCFACFGCGSPSFFLHPKMPRSCSSHSHPKRNRAARSSSRVLVALEKELSVPSDTDIELSDKDEKWVTLID